MNLRSPSIVWRGTHLGIDIEIHSFTMDESIGSPEKCWTYYLLIPFAALPEEVKKKVWLKPRKDKTFGRVFFDYYKSGLLTSIDLHGGITFYEKKYDELGKPWGVKIGCDFQHSWDQGRDYTLEDIQYYVEKSVESLLVLVPDMKKRCSWNGKYYNFDEVVIQPSGNYRSLESINKEN